MTKKSFTPISTLGEFGLIEKLTKSIKIHHKSTQKGIGDDAAVLSSLLKMEQLFPTDTMEPQKALIIHVNIIPTQTFIIN